MSTESDLELLQKEYPDLHRRVMSMRRRGYSAEDMAWNIRLQVRRIERVARKGVMELVSGLPESWWRI